MKPSLSHAIGAAMAAFLGTRMHAGFLLAFLVPVLLGALAFRGLAMLGFANRGAAFWPNMLSWLGAMLIVAGVHVHHHRAARAAATDLVEAVTRHRTEHGRFPQDLSTAPSAIARSAAQWRIFYRPGPDHPQIGYPATFIPFDIYEYDFERSTWVYRS